jgi:hypothetical protein
MQTSGNIRRRYQLIKRLSLVRNIFVISIFSAATEASACGACVFAIFDRFVPPVWLWSAFAIAWFLTVSAIITIHKDKALGIPSFGKAILLVLGFVVAGIMMIGPLGLFLLLLSYPFVAWKAFCGRNARRSNAKVRHTLKKITVTGLICICGLTLYSIFIRTTRPPSEFILRWESTYAGRAYLEELIQCGPESLNDLRVMLEKGNTSSMAAAAEGLSDFGEPDIDIPLLIRALEKCQTDTSCKSKVESALLKMGGMDLLETASY